MLIYCNRLEIDETSSVFDIFGSITGWLKYATGKHFTVDELLSGNEFQLGKKGYVRTYVAEDSDPKLYSVYFSKPDDSIHGRQWNTEIGVKVEQGSPTIFTLLLETSEVSNRVKEVPITTRPKVIGYIKDNCKLNVDTGGISVRHLSSDEDTLNAFHYSIEDPKRKLPIILLSRRTSDGQAYVSPFTLQDKMLGLAQVVICKDDVDTWFMERILSKRYGAWGGAINLIYPLTCDYCRNRLFLPEQLDALLADEKNLNSELLSYVTHYSNIRMKRQHFSHHDVRAKRLSDHRKVLMAELRHQSDEQDLNDFIEEIEELENYNTALKQELEKEQLNTMELEDRLEQASDDFEQYRVRKSKEVKTLKYQLDSNDVSEGPIKIVNDPEVVFNAVKNPTPEHCLFIVAEHFAERVIILDSAWASTKRSDSFKNGQKLADLLYRLCTGYYDIIKEGPETEAKKVFNDTEFAAKESETVRRSSTLRAKREFEYNGENVQMYRHLRIGVRPNVHDTLRVHFHWDAHNQKIVIGYCGPHLPTS